MSNYRLDRDRTLRDYRGTPIGKVDYWNRVRDGYHDKGQIGADDRYIDEHGRDQGWALPDYGGGDGGAGCALLLVMGFVALVVWLISALIEAVGASRSRPSVARGTAIPPRIKPAPRPVPSPSPTSTSSARKTAPSVGRSPSHPTATAPKRPSMPPKPRLR